MIWWWWGGRHTWWRLLLILPTTTTRCRRTRDSLLHHVQFFYSSSSYPPPLFQCRSKVLHASSLDRYPRRLSSLCGGEASSYDTSCRHAYHIRTIDREETSSSCDGSAVVGTTPDGRQHPSSTTLLDYRRYGALAWVDGVAGPAGRQHGRFKWWWVQHGVAYAS